MGKYFLTHIKGKKALDKAKRKRGNQEIFVRSVLIMFRKKKEFLSRKTFKKEKEQKK